MSRYSKRCVLRQDRGAPIIQITWPAGVMQASCNTQSPNCHLLMPILLSVDFSCESPLGEAIASHLAKLAESIAEEPGLIWKIWTENAHESTVGGVFGRDEASGSACLQKREKRLTGFAIPGLWHPGLRRQHRHPSVHPRSSAALPDGRWPDQARMTGSGGRSPAEAGDDLLVLSRRLYQAVLTPSPDHPHG